jgi:hypothetical protein
MTRHGSPSFSRVACALPAMTTLASTMPLHVLTNITRLRRSRISSRTQRRTASFQPTDAHPGGCCTRLKPARKLKTP